MEVSVIYLEIIIIINNLPLIVIAQIDGQKITCAPFVLPLPAIRRSPIRRGGGGGGGCRCQRCPYRRRSPMPIKRFSPRPLRMRSPIRRNHSRYGSRIFP